MADAKWSSNADFAPQPTILGTDRIMGLRSGANIKSLGILAGTDQVTGLDAALAAKMDEVLTTKGDLVGFSTLPVRVAIGTDGQVPTADSKEAAGWKWGDNGSGDVTGPASSTDGGFAVYNGTTGKVIQDNEMKPILLPFTYNNFGVTTDGTANGTVCVPPSNNYVLSVNVSRDLATNDAFTVLNSNNSSPVTFTIREQADVPFPLGGWTDIIITSGGGAITIAGAGAVIFRAPGNILTTTGLYTGFRLRRVISNTWDIIPIGIQAFATGSIVTFTPDNYVPVDDRVEGHLQGIDDALATIDENAITFSAYQSPQQSIPNNVETQVNFQIEEFDVGGGFASNVFTAPESGFYYFPVKGAMAAPGTADAQVTWRLYQNATNVSEDNQIILMGDVDRSFDVSKLLQLTAGDTVEVKCLVTGNGGNALSVNSGIAPTYFQGYLVSAGNITKTPVSVTGTTKTLGLSDGFTLQVCDNAATQTITVPLNSSVAFPIGTQIDLTQYGIGQVEIAATGGVTINSKLGNLKVVAQYAGCSLIKTGTDTWWLTGDLAA